MIILQTHRQYAQAAHDAIFPYIKMLKQSHFNNVAAHSKVSEQRLIVKLIYSLLDGIELNLKKKLINCTGRILKLKLTDAEAIALYKTFLLLPIEADKYYLHLVRQEWLNSLDKQIFN